MDRYCTHASAYLRERGRKSAQGRPESSLVLETKVRRILFQSRGPRNKCFARISARTGIGERTLYRALRLCEIRDASKARHLPSQRLLIALAKVGSVQQQAKVWADVADADDDATKFAVINSHSRTPDQARVLPTMITRSSSSSAIFTSSKCDAWYC